MRRCKNTQAARRRALARLWHFHTVQAAPASETGKTSPSPDMEKAATCKNA